MVISRKFNLLVFLIVISLIFIFPISLAGLNSWDIHANKIFFRGSGDGPITLHDAGTASKIQIVDGGVEFTDLTIGAGSIDFIGFNASENANITALAVGRDLVVFNIDAVNGANTETIIKAPPNTFDVDVDGEDSFSFNATTRLVSVQETHGPDTKQIIVFFNRTSSIQNVTGEWIEYQAVSILNLTGVHTEGDLNSTFFIDGDFWNHTEVAGPPGHLVQINFSGVDPDAECLWVTIFYLYTGNALHVFNIEMWNFTSSAWVNDGHLIDGVALAWTNSTIYAMRIPLDFLSGGEVRVQLNHESPGNMNHELSIDYIRLVAKIPADVAIAGVNWGLLWFLLILICVPIALVLLKESRR